MHANKHSLDLERSIERLEGGGACFRGAVDPVRDLLPRNRHAQLLCEVVAIAAVWRGKRGDVNVRMLRVRARMRTHPTVHARERVRSGQDAGATSARRCCVDACACRGTSPQHVIRFGGVLGSKAIQELVHAVTLSP